MGGCYKSPNAHFGDSPTSHNNELWAALIEKAYALTDYDAGTGMFPLENPWGEQHVDLTWAQLETMSTYFVGSV